VAPKLAGFFILARIVTLALPGVEAQAWRLVALLAAVTMTWGNVVALWQDNLRRLLAYSSIAHAGYMLIGLAMSLAAVSGQTTGGFDPLASVFFYLAIYSIASVGLLAAITYLGTPGNEVNNVDELAGLAKTQPLVALAMAVFLFSMAGIPPLAGFWGKLMLFGSAADVALSGDWATNFEARWSGILAIIGVLNAAIAAAYYLRIIGAMYFRDPVGRPAVQGGSGAGWATLVAAVLVIGIGCFPGKVRTEVSKASQSAHAAAKSLSLPLGENAPPVNGPSANGPALAEAGK
jgi:NADH-quinone oxidoreductase subunit N